MFKAFLYLIIITLCCYAFNSCTDKNEPTSPEVNYMDKWADTLYASGIGVYSSDTTISDSIRRAGSIKAAKMVLIFSLISKIKSLRVTESVNVENLMLSNDSISVKINSYTKCFRMNSITFYADSSVQIEGSLPTNGIKDIINQNSK